MKKTRSTITLKKVTFLLVGLLIFCGCQQSRLEQKLEVVAWNGPDSQNLNDDRFTDIAEAGFTAVSTFYDSVKANKAALELAQHHHLRLLISDPRLRLDSLMTDTTFTRIDNVIFDYGTMPALMGYVITFSPSSKYFSILGRVVQHFQQKDPDHVAYINIYPSSTSIIDLGESSYQEYLKKYLEQVKPQMLSFNHFPIQKFGFQEDYYYNLELIRQMALANNLPFWGFVLTWPHDFYPMPTESQLRMQVFSNLAYGARGIQYYTYCPPGSNDGELINAIIDTGYNKTRTYRHVELINHEITYLTPIWRYLHSIGVYHTAPIPMGGRELDFDLPILKIEGENILLGFFMSRKHIPYFLIVNRNYNSGARPRLYFDNEVQGITEIGKTKAGVMIVNFDPTEAERSVGILLKAGDGRLFRIRL